MERKVTSIKEHQEILYELLYVMDDFCKEHDIKYFLAYGTMLGAVRHNGIIPWDDDVDVMMTRNEYDRFKKLITINPPKGYKGYNIDNTKGYYYPFIKFGKLGTRLIEKDWKCVPSKGIGINIDIFPIDGCPKDKKTAEKYVVEEVDKFMNNIRYWCNGEWTNFVSKRQKIRYWFRKRHIFLKPFFKKLFEELTQYELKDSNYFFVYWPYNNTKGLLPSNLINSTIFVKFGDRMLPIPKDYDTILHALYGDYMIFPPENKRQSTHINELFIDE